MKKNKVGRRGLKASFLLVVLLPLLVFTVAVTFFTINKFKNTMLSEIKIELRNNANAVAKTIDTAYPGDYYTKGSQNVAVLKGDKVLNGDNEIIDYYKDTLNVEITLFYGNTRVLTTICDDDDQRIVGTTVLNIISNGVMNESKSKFYSKATIDDKDYYAYYMPLINSDGVCIGMLAIAKPADDVMSKIYKSATPILIVSIFAFLIGALIAIIFAESIVNIITKLKRFLKSISDGDFNASISDKVYMRSDEFGDMARSAIEMQKSLKTLVEQDALTKINNRRSGDKLLIDIQNKSSVSGVPFTVVIGDIDHFKLVNDTYGHECGDKVLQGVANVLKSNMVGKGYVARWGGEEFLLIFDKLKSDEAFKEVEEILDKIRSLKINYQENIIGVTMTFGITDGTDKEPIHTIVKKADNKLYSGKQNGRNRVII